MATARRRKTVAGDTAAATASASSARSNEVTLSLPKLDRSLYMPILVVLLIIASFLLGMLVTKVQYLEKNGSSSNNNQQANAAAGAAPTGAAAPQPTGYLDPKDVGHLPVLGQDSAPVTLVEFADFRCPFCEQFYTNTFPQLQQDYINTGKVKMYFRHWAFLGPASITASDAAECANEQGHFWDYYNWLYKNQPSETDTSMYTTDKLSQAAGDLGMDTNQFSQCLDSKKYEKNVTDDYNAGQKAGVSGTPTFYINGTQIVGAVPYAQIKSAIDDALKKAGQ